MCGAKIDIENIIDKRELVPEVYLNAIFHIDACDNAQLLCLKIAELIKSSKCVKANAVSKTLSIVMHCKNTPISVREKMIEDVKNSLPNIMKVSKSFQYVDGVARLNDIVIIYLNDTFFKVVLNIVFER